METKKTKSCPFCGEEIDMDSVTCQFCGESLVEETTENNMVIEERSIKKYYNTFFDMLKNHSKYVIFGTIAIISVIVLIVVLNRDSKTYMKDLEWVTETRNSLLLGGEEEVELLKEKNGDIFTGEAWEDNDLECLFVSGVIIEIRFYYPNGQLAACLPGIRMTDVTYDIDYFDSNGNKISRQEFQHVYIDKYRSKLKHVNYFEEF